MVLFTKLLTFKYGKIPTYKILSMVLFTKLLTLSNAARNDSVILSMVLFTKLLTSVILNHWITGF